MAQHTVLQTGRAEAFIGVGLPEGLRKPQTIKSGQPVGYVGRQYRRNGFEMYYKSNN